MKSKRQIKNFILKTLLPYKEDPSKCGTNKSGNCVYLTGDGKKCAFGRWMKKGEWQNQRRIASGVLNEYGNKILLKEARDMGFSGKQWNDIQNYHDSIGMRENISQTNNIVRRLEDKFGIELPELKLKF